MGGEEGNIDDYTQDGTVDLKGNPVRRSSRRGVLSEEEELPCEINMMRTTCPCHHRQHFDPSSNDNFISSISYPQIFGYLIPTLVAVMGANVQGTNEPLMETRRVSLCVSLVAIIFYYIAFAADNISRRYQANFLQLCGPIALIFGSLAVVSLVSTFFTESVAEVICYVALGCSGSTAIIMVAYQYGRKLMDACHWLYHKILRPSFCKILNWLKAHYNKLFARAAATSGSVI